MDPDRLNFAQRGKRALQLALQRALKFTFSGKSDPAQFAASKARNRDAHCAATRSPQSPGGRHRAVLGNQQTGAIGRDLVRNVFGREASGELPLLPDAGRSTKSRIRLAEQRTKSQSTPATRTSPPPNRTRSRRLRPSRNCFRRCITSSTVEDFGDDCVISPSRKSVRTACARSPRMRTRSCSAPASSAEN